MKTIKIRYKVESKGNPKNYIVKEFDLDFFNEDIKKFLLKKKKSQSTDFSLPIEIRPDVSLDFYFNRARKEGWHNWRINKINDQEGLANFLAEIIRRSKIKEIVKSLAVMIRSNYDSNYDYGKAYEKAKSLLNNSIEKNDDIQTISIKAEEIYLRETKKLKARREYYALSRERQKIKARIEKAQKTHELVDFYFFIEQQDESIYSEDLRICYKDKIDPTTRMRLEKPSCVERVLRYNSLNIKELPSFLGGCMFLSPIYHSVSDSFLNDFFLEFNIELVYTFNESSKLLYWQKLENRDIASELPMVLKEIAQKFEVSRADFIKGEINKLVEYVLSCREDNKILYSIYKDRERLNT